MWRLPQVFEQVQESSLYDIRGYANDRRRLLSSTEVEPTVSFVCFDHGMAKLCFHKTRNAETERIFYPQNSMKTRLWNSSAEIRKNIHAECEISL